MRAFNLILVAAIFAATADAQDKPVVEVAGFSVAKKDPKSEFGSSYSNFHQPGLNVDLFFMLPGKTVLSIDQKQTAMTLSTDDGGALELREQFDGVVNLNLREDNSSGILQLRSDALPGAKSTALIVDGTAVLIVGKDLKTEDVTVTIEEGAAVKIGGIEATIGEIGEAFGDPFKQQFSLSAKSSFDALAKLEFVDAKGNLIESQSAGGGSFGFNDDITYSQGWQIASEAKQVTMRVSWFTKTEAVKLPVKLKFGLGL